MKAVILLLVLAATAYGYKLDHLANIDIGRYNNRVLDDLLYQQLNEALEGSSNEKLSQDYFDIDPQYYDDYEIRTNHRDMEIPLETDSLSDEFKYIQGGAGEGEQNLHPDGSQPNKNGVMSDEKLLAYCNPPNPCPAGYKGPIDECDQTPVDGFSAKFSKEYQESQDCMCDEDHNDCSNSLTKKSSEAVRVELIKKDVILMFFYTHIRLNLCHLMCFIFKDRFSAVVAKKSPSQSRKKRVKKRFEKITLIMKNRTINNSFFIVLRMFIIN